MECQLCHVAVAPCFTFLHLGRDQAIGIKAIIIQIVKTEEICRKKSPLFMENDKHPPGLQLGLKQRHNLPSLLTVPPNPTPIWPQKMVQLSCQKTNQNKKK